MCAALSECLAPFSPGGEVSVSACSQNDDGTFTPETVVLTTTVSAGC